MTGLARVSHLVVVGASAGGIEALSALVAALPADFPAAVVIAQHLDPRRPSRLDEILARRSQLPVRTVANHEALRAGTIFVVPSDRHVEITDHAVILQPGTPGSKPSVDRLFSSAISTFGEKLIAVVLSGTGSDGTLGARLVHEAGGTVVIQNPATAAFPGMPRSLAPSTVDIVAELADMGTILQSIVTGAHVRERTDDASELGLLLTDLRERRGLDFSSYRPPTILRRLQRRMTAVHSDTLADYRRYVRENPEEEARLISNLLIKVTDFFRDPTTFTHLREQVLPQLIQLPVGIALVNRRYDIQLINAAARRLLGIHGLAVGEDLLHLLDSVAVPPPRAVIDAAFRGETPASLDEVATAALGLGEARSLHITCLPHVGGADRAAVTGVLIVVIDVTAMVQRRQTVERLQEGQQQELERLKDLMEQLGATNRRLLAANDELAYAEAALRTTNEEYLAASAQAEAASEELQTYSEELQSSNEELETLNEELKATVEELSLSNADLDARGQELAIQRAASDGERTQLAAILADMGDAVVLVDAAGRSVRSNATYDALLESVGGDFVPRDEQGLPLPVEATPQQRAARGERFSLAFTLTAEDRARRWFEANGQPLRGGDQPGGLVVIRDITDRSLRHLQEQFIGLAGHELRTPLTGLVGHLQLLLRQLARESPNERLNRSAETALRQAQRLHGLIESLMDVTRLESGKLDLHLAAVDLAAVATQAVSLVQVLTPEQTIALDPGPEPLSIQANAGRLEDVLLNLLTNATKYAPGSERIDVRLRRVGDEAEIQVEDYGVGIPSAELPLIFSRFYQVTRTDSAARGGLGLGLFITREIVTAHGGTIEVQSVLGKGTTFVVRLPLVAGDAGWANPVAEEPDNCQGVPR